MNGTQPYSEHSSGDTFFTMSVKVLSHPGHGIRRKVCRRQLDLLTELPKQSVRTEEASWMRGKMSSRTLSSPVAYDKPSYGLCQRHQIWDLWSKSFSQEACVQTQGMI